jgi:hypothetical protein
LPVIDAPAAWAAAASSEPLLSTTHVASGPPLPPLLPLSLQLLLAALAALFADTTAAADADADDGTDCAPSAAACCRRGCGALPGAPAAGQTLQVATG